MMDLLHALEDHDASEIAGCDFDLSGMLEEDPIPTTMASEILFQRQECNFKAMERAMSKINIELITEKWEFEDHLSTLKAKWDSIDKLHWQLDQALKSTNLHENYSTKFDKIENKYDELKKQLNGKIWANKHFEKSAPKIELQEFNGDYVRWISFKNLFMETIHKNPTISKPEKMQHLKTKLKGEAENLVQHLAVSAENYDSCWEILTRRYDNHRLQFTTFMNAMQQLPVIQNPTVDNIKKIHDVITESLNGLTNMSVDVKSWGPMIVHYMSQKLDAVTFNEYSKEIQNNREIPDLKEFLTFLENQFMALETVKNRQTDTNNSQKQSGNTNSAGNVNSNKPINKNTGKPNYNKMSTFYKDNKDQAKSTYYTAYGKCPLCDGNHVLMQCAKFTEMNVSQRNSAVAKLKVCKNCLYVHGNNECNSTKTCKECNYKHHTLLHYAKKSQEQTKPENNNSEITSADPSTSCHSATGETEVLLTTVKIRVKAKDGTYQTFRALLDQGSQVNLISENAAQVLRLPRRKYNATINGVGSVSGECKGQIKLTCKSIHNDFTFGTQALILKKLTNDLPTCTFEKANWPHLQNLKLGDPDYNVRGSVDLLLSADVYADIIMDGVLRGDQHSPVAQQTQLGWILCGKLKTLSCHATIINLDDISKYWESEDITEDKNKDNNDHYCEKYYQDTTKRTSDGKYIVKMPMTKNFEAELGESRSKAVSQFINMEKRLTKNEKLCSMYRDFMDEYLELGHMKLTQQNNENQLQQCYLPHHGVLRENATTTKLRVVFNASSKTQSGKSLNTLMEKGPNLQKDIQALILKWKTYKYAYTADIEKMYRCIWLVEDQQLLQKIIWRSTNNEPLRNYTLCTLTYGTKCAPWLAMRTLKQLALDYMHKYPSAAKILQTQFYLDDLISGDNSLENAKLLQSSLIKLLREGGMNLRKWSSNCPELLHELSEDQISTKRIFDFEDENTKTLGLSWNPKLDTFMFNWTLEENTKNPLTKRALLSEISQLYDPMGWLSPVTVTAKLIFQRVWEQDLEWDEQLTTKIQEDWLKLKAEIPDLKSIKLKRWIGGTQKDLELLGFCDASEKAYACVIYTRVMNESGQLVLNLLAAKTRVAPIAQKLSLPRLELCAALLLSQLMEKTKNSLNENNVTIWAWSDSKVVLAWLQGEPTKWERYVENRVKKIRHVIPSTQWAYIESKSNPADCATRGVSPKKLLDFDLWWNGPEMLKIFTGNLENQTKTLNCLFTTDVEQKKDTALTITKTNDNIINEIINKYSSLVRVRRIVAWMMRFITKARFLSPAVTPDTARVNNAITTYLTTAELLASNELIVKCMQRSYFEMECNLLSKNKTLTNKSSIYKLSPYLENGVLRVGGRLNKTNLPAGMKNPMILPRNGRLVQLVIEEAHAATLHGGARLTLAYLRQRYWIIGGNHTVKFILRKCVRCRRFKPTDNYQYMADLPTQRATPSRPFTHTGVDFTGSIDLKLNKGRGVKTTKGYIAIFVCMATKAVHIELVSDLSTEMFIEAFKRMCARRGTPRHMYSDCGTNFIGTSRILGCEFELWKKELSTEFFVELGKMEVEWHFNAPAWPTAGGLWEASVRSMKHHLRRILGDQRLTYEEFSTLLCKIEACMNSRPLCPLTEDPEDYYNYLTPGHFLTGSPTMTLPLSNYEDKRNVDLRQRWQLTQHMLNRFWKLWSTDYVTQLQTRSKWQKPTPNLVEGDIVLVKNDNLPPGKWAMGKVTEVHPGEDGIVRVATIKTQAGVMKRPITKMTKLLTHDENIGRHQ